MIGNTASASTWARGGMLIAKKKRKKNKHDSSTRGGSRKRFHSELPAGVRILKYDPIDEETRRYYIVPKK